MSRAPTAPALHGPARLAIGATCPNCLRWCKYGIAASNAPRERPIIWAPIPMRPSFNRPIAIL